MDARRLSSIGAWTLIVIVAVGVTDAVAVTLNPGDLLVANGSGLFVVNPLTGGSAMFSAGPVSDVAMTGRTIYAIGGGGVVRIDPDTGARRIIASGGLLSGRAISGIDIAPSGAIFVATAKEQAIKSIIQIDPSTGAQALVASDRLFDGFVTDLAIDHAGRILFIDFLGSVRALDPSAGSLTYVAEIPGHPTGIDIGPNGDLFVADLTACRIWRIDPATGTGKGATHLQLCYPWAIAVDTDGEAFVTYLLERYARVEGLGRVNLQSGAVDIFSPISGTGLAIVGVVPQVPPFVLMISAIAVGCFLRWARGRFTVIERDHGSPWFSARKQIFENGEGKPRSCSQRSMTGSATTFWTSASSSTRGR
ncbi:MAG: hypothetical protein WAP47_14495 [Candidatus Rokuibacteriota bacterium]